MSSRVECLCPLPALAIRLLAAMLLTTFGARDGDIKQKLGTEKGLSREMDDLRVRSHGES